MQETGDITAFPSKSGNITAFPSESGNITAFPSEPGNPADTSLETGIIGTSPEIVEQYGVFEVVLTGKTAGNPFTDYTITGRFTSDSDTRQVDGFYDGDGIYRVRFMPSHTGNGA